MAIHKYENLSHSEFAALRRDKTAILIPVGPLEQHGPHLPLGVDAFSAGYFSEQLANRLAKEKADWNFLIFPTIFAGCDTIDYAGSVELRPAILRAYLYDCCRALARDGFKTLIAVSTHGGPKNMVVLEEVAEKMRWRHRVRMVSASAKILTDIIRGRFIDNLAKRLKEGGTPLNDDERTALKTDYHAGLLETSVMQVIRPDLVKPHGHLKPAIVASYLMLRRNSGKKAGEGLGYLGHPAQARPEIGAAAIEAVFDSVVPPLKRFLDGQNVKKEFRSLFYYIPIFRTDFRLLLFLIGYIVIFGLGIMLSNRFLLEIFK